MQRNVLMLSVHLQTRQSQSQTERNAYLAPNDCHGHYIKLMIERSRLIMLISCRWIHWFFVAFIRLKIIKEMGREAWDRAIIRRACKQKIKRWNSPTYLSLLDRAIIRRSCKQKIEWWNSTTYLSLIGSPHQEILASPWSFLWILSWNCKVIHGTRIIVEALALITKNGIWIFEYWTGYMKPNDVTSFSWPPWDLLVRTWLKHYYMEYICSVFSFSIFFFCPSSDVFVYFLLSYFTKQYPKNKEKNITNNYIKIRFWIHLKGLRCFDHDNPVKGTRLLLFRIFIFEKWLAGPF